ncbi:MAG: sigma-70 family RNA polymerase sigma factor [Gemmatimonadaceae bacterium]
MPPANPEALFLENLPLIEKVAASLARRYALTGEDAADFASWIKLRLVESDYAALRKFRGESAIGTYLTVVVSMLGRDYRVQHWGRWRPSAAARRIGDVAVRLESLVRRQGYRVEQAGEILRTAGETQLNDRELAQLLQQLPTRAPMRPVEVGAEPLSMMEHGTTPEELVMGDEAYQERQRLWRHLDATMREYSTEDRLVLRMRFWEEMSVAEIARALGLEQKPLYRRIDRLLADLRRRLLSAGISAEQCRALLSEAAA